MINCRALGRWFLIVFNILLYSKYANILIMISRKTLLKLYSRYSANEIARIINCSPGQVNYWLKIFKIKKRSISDAVYKKHNPNGDPFRVKLPKNNKEAFLFGIGLGLYWGEGTKSNKMSIRLGNTNPRIIKCFVKFLQTFYKIDKDKLRFGLQIFGDIPKEETLNFWQRELDVDKAQFYKVLVSKIRGEGTYKIKSKYGVITVYFNNKKLRDILCKEIEKL